MKQFDSIRPRTSFSSLEFIFLKFNIFLEFQIRFQSISDLLEFDSKKLENLDLDLNVNIFTDIIVQT